MSSDIADRIAASVDGGAAVAANVVPDSELPPESAALVATARSKVIPFVNDDDAAEIRSLVDALATAAASDVSSRHAELATALRRFSYLL